MYLAELAVFLSSCYNIANGFSLYGHRDGLNFLLKENNATAGLFDDAPILTKWMSQPLDHFDENESRTWKMRYFERLDMWKPKGPIFLFINGEGVAEEGFLKTGIMFELAKETNGAMFLTEHRYYGESKPFNKYTTENIKFLSSRQALADNAKLIQDIIKLSPLFSSSKVVVVGGSYAGNLAAWMRLIYPDLVDAAIASSGPVLAKADFFEYLETVSDVFEKYGTPGCHDKIGQIFRRYEELFSSDEGIKRLKDEEQICEVTDMNKLENQHFFFSWKASIFMSQAQYGDLKSIKKQCKDINDSFHVISSKDEETDMWNERDHCYDYDYDRHNEFLKRTEFVMTWIYQTCTEFGYFQTANSKNQPFTSNIPIDFYYKTCTAIFGPNFDEERVNQGVQKSNVMYGGLNPNVTNVVFVNGELDPWHRLSILKDLSYDAPAKFIPFSSHCRDLLSNRSEDPEELKEARKYIKYLIKKWIGAGEFLNVH